MLQFQKEKMLLMRKAFQLMLQFQKEKMLLSLEAKGLLRFLSRLQWKVICMM
jgi:hypothetical protein